MISRIQRSHNELQAASELKSNFIHVASHELRKAAAQAGEVLA
jgi:hypothetical protein